MLRQQLRLQRVQMPNRMRVSLDQIADRKNLADAVYLAARGKRLHANVGHFLSSCEDNLNGLAREIVAGTYLPSPYDQFVINDPKRRTIHAPVFRDRVLHHAIVLITGEHLDRTLIDDSFACRVGKGSLAAVHRAQSFCQRYPWYAKVDVLQYFHSIDHEVLMDAFARRFKGKRFLNLIERIVCSFEASNGKGLAIGALTSQYFANLYLNLSDRWLSSQQEVRSVVRYMDDTICWFNDKASAKAIVVRIEEFLRDQLQLELSRRTQINRSSHGLPFCGHLIFPGIVKLSKRRKRLYITACLKSEREYLDGKISAMELQAAYASAYAMSKHANSLQWRKTRLQQHLLTEV